MGEETAAQEREGSLNFAGLLCCSTPTNQESEEVQVEETEEAGSRKVHVVERDLSQSFALEVSHMPPPAIPNDPPHLVIKDRHIPDLTLEQLEDALLSDSMFEQYLAESTRSFDISLSFWGTAPGGLRVRRAHFTMPVPQEVPPALARLIKLPQNSKATMVLGFSKSAEELLVFIQQVTHDVPCGENFRVQETMRFCPHPQGGLVLNKWTLVKWVKALPWMMAAMRPITESKTAAGSVPATDAFVEAVRKAAVL